MSDRQGERDLTASIRELAATLERDLRDHPTPEELQDFLAGDLPADQRERIEEHLALCRDCARAAVELAEVPEIQPEKRGELVTEAEIEAQWKRFQTAAGISRRPRRIAALAAALLIGLLGFAAWQEMTRPRTDEQVIYLQPVDDILRSPRGEDTINRGGRFVLVLDLLESESDPVDAGHRLEVQTLEGREVLSLRDVRPHGDGTFTLTIPRRALPAGEYRILLFDPQGKRIAGYLLRIDPESS